MSPAEFASHPIFSMVDRLLDLSKSPELASPELLSNEASASAVESVFAVVEVLQSRLRRATPQLVSGYGLSQLQSGLQSVYNELSSYQSNKNPGHLQNARAQVEQAVLPQVWSFGPSTEQGSDESQRVLSGISARAKEAIAQLTSERDELSSRISVLAGQVAESVGRLEQLTEAVAKQRAEAGSVVAVVQQAHAEKEAERATAFDSLLRDLREQFAVLLKSASDSQAGHLVALRKSEAEAAQIVQVVGNIGITGNYQKIATSESEQANTWRRITIGFFAAGMLLACLTFLKFWHEPITPENTWSALVRLMYALAITAPAWYAARESARHRSNSDRARQTELELASLGPFIELMPEEKKNQIREELTKRYFGNQVAEHVAGPPIEFKDIKELSVELVKAAKK